MGLVGVLTLILLVLLLALHVVVDKFNDFLPWGHLLVGGVVVGINLLDLILLDLCDLLLLLLLHHRALTDEKSSLVCNSLRVRPAIDLSIDTLRVIFRRLRASSSCNDRLDQI